MEAENPPPVVVPTPAAGDPAAVAPRRKLSPMVTIGIAFAMLAGGVTYLLVGTGAQSALVYSKQVHEVVAHPAQWQGRELRVEGLLKQGSVQFRQQPCEWRFVLEKQERQMPVRFPQCVVPDTFRDNMGITVTVQGRISPDGTFLANQVIPRCPSKYEMQKRQNAGERRPASYGMPPAPPAPT